MSSGYRLTLLARDDLFEIADFVANDNAVAAEQLIDRFEKAFEQLVQYPHAGHIREDLLDTQYRVWPVGPYLIVYRPDTAPLQIIRIWHAARGMPDIL